MNIYDYEISRQSEIVVVDDTLDSLQLLTEILQKHGYKVRPVSSASYALETVASKRPNLILLDIKMPEMDGYEVCRRLKADIHSRKVPVIFISALDQTTEKVNGFQAGGVDYITKPFKPEEVLARVNTHLRLQELTEHLEQEVNLRTAELRESKKRYSEIVEGTDNLITEVDEQGRFIFVNETARKVFGLSPQECIGRTAFDFIHPDDREITYKSFLRWIEDKKPSVTFENRQMSRSGKVTDMHWTINLHFDDRENITSIKSIARDVSEQKKAQAELSREAEINRATAELSRNLLSPVSIEEISFLVIEQAKRVTRSAFGFAGHIDPDTGYLVCPTLTRDIWDTCRIADKNIVFKKFTGLWGWVLKNRRPLLTNAAVDDTRSTGTPAGHIPIHRFLSAPACINETLVGQVAVANSDNDYAERDLQAIERLANLYAIAIQRQLIEQELKTHRDRLEEMVKERTAELTVANDRLQQEILEREKVERKLRHYAETQKVLVREVNHRVKNNLSALIGMLHMEEDRAQAEGTIQYLPALRDLICRIDGLATVHSLLSASGWRPVEVDELCKQVVDAALNGVPLGRRMRVKVIPSTIKINSTQAHHLTLIINELATNSMKYAFGNRDEANITIEFHQQESSLTIIFTDDGPGYPERILQDNVKLSSIGFELIRGIASRSLNGTVDFSNDDGALARIVFNNEQSQRPPEVAGDLNFRPSA